ncbi:hypothetical protein [Nonomuraea recticatena]
MPAPRDLQERLVQRALALELVGVPSAAILPPSMTRSRSQSASASSR